jgi:hypothetical protein
MTLTREQIALMLVGYIEHKISLSEIVHKSETWIQDAAFESGFEDDIMVVLSQLGLADVKVFGLGIEDLEGMFNTLGYKLDFKPQFEKAA